jgi:predicted enzyme related to lactoylglutathione lyase
MYSLRTASFLTLALAVLSACGSPEAGEPPEGASAGEDPSSAPPAPVGAVPGIQGLNPHYYYQDLDRAWGFYADVLGFETVADYGVMKIMRIAEASFVTLVDAEYGRRPEDEPKSVTLAVVTEQVEAWYDYLRSRAVAMRHELGEIEPGRPHDGFVAVDPEGYLLEFERFNPHDENVDLMPVLEGIRPVSGETGRRAEGLEVQGTVLWLYYEDLAPPMAFYEEVLGVPLLVDQGWAKVYQASGTGFVGLVDGARGLHQATDRAAVTVSFLTDDVEAWFARGRALELPLEDQELRTRGGTFELFAARDPGGYALEWATPLRVDWNDRLREVVR